MIFRWNFCREAYAGPILSSDGKRQIKDLATISLDGSRFAMLWQKEVEKIQLSYTELTLSYKFLFIYEWLTVIFPFLLSNADFLHMQL